AVLDALDEARAGLRMLVLPRRPPRTFRLAVPVPVPFRTTLADAVLLVKADVEPDRRIERAVLVKTEPGEVLIEIFRALRVGEITVRDPPVRNRPDDAVNQ